MERRRHGVRLVRPLSMVEEVLSTLGSGQRLDILHCLADRPKHVTMLAKELFLSVKVVSKDLERLESCGLVVSTKVKTMRLYSLTNRVRVLRHLDLVQLVIQTTSGRWLLLNFDSSTQPDLTVDPPTVFVWEKGSWPDLLPAPN